MGSGKIFIILVINFFSNCRSYCPDKCECRLERAPWSVICSHQELNEFPKKISGLVIKFFFLYIIKIFFLIK